MSKVKQCEFYVEGMHCASCEILLEQKLLEQSGIVSVNASLQKQLIQIEYTSKKPSIFKLNKIFNEHGYKIFHRDGKNTLVAPGLTSLNDKQSSVVNSAVKIILLIFLVGGGFAVIEKSGILRLVYVNKSSSLLAFFLFGLAAGVSTCAALVGGLLLSLTNKWANQKAKPFVSFNIGRLISFSVLGGVLGIIGGAIKISLTFSSILVVGVSVVMFVLGMQMLGFEFVNKIGISLPKTLKKLIFLDGLNPFFVGALTFLFPCGFTLIAQSLALTSGSFINGSLIMFSFALGTLPMLGLISVAGVKFNQNRSFSYIFNKVTGVLVILFAVYSLNSQLNVLGMSSLNDILLSAKQKLDSQFISNGSNEAALPTVIDGKQTIYMTASSYGYSPERFTVKAGVPVVWNIQNTGNAGCAGTLVSRDLAVGPVVLQTGDNTQEFTAPAPGTYKFSCFMGMFRGTIKAI